MNHLLKLFANDKGRDANRTLVLAVLLWTAWKVDGLEKNLVAHLQAHAGKPVPAQHAAAPAAPEDVLAHLPP